MANKYSDKKWYLHGTLCSLFLPNVSNFTHGSIIEELHFFEKHFYKIKFYKVDLMTFAIKENSIDFR